MADPNVGRARPDELEAINELATTAFRVNNPNHPSFDLLYPHGYREETFPAEDHLVIRDGGRPVAMVALRPLRFAVGPNMIDVAGIGDVCTHRDYRGRGYMTVLMKVAEAEIDDRGFVLGFLGGERARYGRFGWEQAGCYWTFGLTEKYLAEIDLSDWTIEEPETIEPWMHAAIEEKPFRRSMAFDEMIWAVKRIGRRNLTAQGPGGRAVVVYDHATDETDQARSVTIDEWGGSPDAILALGTELARRKDVADVSLTTPAVGDGLTRLLRARAWSYGPRTAANVRVCRLAELLMAYFPWMSRCPNVCPGGITLRMTDVDQAATLVLDDAPSIVDAPGQFEVALNRLDMTTFLFGPLPPSRVFDLPHELAALDAIFPLPIFASSISGV